jgi:hypothetical protein
MARSKKKKKKAGNKQSLETFLTPDQKKLFDRILIGLGVSDDVDIREGFVPIYILNPSAKGSRKRVSGNCSTWPAFGLVGAHNDEMMRAKLGIDHDEVELVPFWMSRFLAATDEGLLIGYTFCPVDRSSFIIATMEIDYTLAEKMFGSSPGEIHRDLQIDEVVVAIRACAEVIKHSSGVPFAMKHVALLDVGPDAFIQSKGGDA